MAYDLAVSGAALTFTTGKFDRARATGRAAATNLMAACNVGLTIECWVRAPSVGTTLRCFIGQSAVFYLGALANTGTAVFNMYSVATDSGVNICDNAYHHIRLEVSNTGRRYWVDGVYVGGAATPYAVMAAGDFMVGDFGANNLGWVGEIDDVAVYNGVIQGTTANFTPPTVRTASNAAGLLALYRFEDNNLNSQGASPATAITWTGPASGTVGTASSDYTAGADGTITGTVVVTPTDGGAGGTWTPTSRSLTSASPTGKFTYTAATTGAKTLSVTNNGSLANPASITYTAVSGGATTTTFTGPTTGVRNAASTDFTAGADASITGNVTVTPSDGGAGGNWVPTSAVISSASPTALFKYTATTLGARNLTITNNGGLANPAAIVYTSTASTNNQFIPANMVLSPGNWEIQSSPAKAISNNPGAYFRTKFTGNSCMLGFDMTNHANTSLLKYRIDDFGPWTTVPMAATVDLVMPFDTLIFPEHTLEVWYRSHGVMTNRWTNSDASVKINGIYLDTGKGVYAVPTKPLSIWVYGDSIVEGALVINRTASDQAYWSDSQLSYMAEVARLLGAEFGAIGFGSTGWITGAAGVPVLTSSYNQLSAGVARSFANAPDAIVICHGQNDGPSVTTAATTVLNGLIAATPRTTKIIVLVPLSGTHSTELAAAIAACTTPSRCVLLPTTGFFNTANTANPADTIHPNAAENVSHIAPLVAAAIRPFLSPLKGARVPRTISITFESRSQVPRANLTGLKWSWFDQNSQELLTVPADSGIGATTDASGVFSINSVYSTLAPGAEGWLQVGDGSTNQLAFSGKVTVS